MNDIVEICRVRDAYHESVAGKAPKTPGDALDALGTTLDVLRPGDMHVAGRVYWQDGTSDERGMYCDARQMAGALRYRLEPMYHRNIGKAEFDVWREL